MNLREMLTLLLGNDFGEEEMNNLLIEDPQLAKSGPELNRIFDLIRNEPLPSLDPKFTEQVVAKIHPASGPSSKNKPKKTQLTTRASKPQPYVETKEFSYSKVQLRASGNQLNNQEALVSRISKQTR